MIPHLRLRRETLLVDCADGVAKDFQPVETGVIELSFEYERREDRDDPAEQHARRTLEALGPVELDCLDDCAAPPGAKVDYVVDVVGDPAALCSFSAQAIPRLKALGWSVIVEPDYPCHVVTDGTWYAEIREEQERDWFELELGIDVEGQRVDLLPILLELLRDRRRLGAMLRDPRRRIAVPLGGQRFLALPPERLHAIVQVLAELYDMDGAPQGTALRVPRHLPHYFGELEEVLEQETVQWSGAPELRRRARALVRPQAQDVEPPPGLQATLRPYQRVGLAWLQALREQGFGGVLADDMGLGKTLQTIAHLVTERDAGRLRSPALVVAPTSLAHNWRRELQRFAPYLRSVIYHGPQRARMRRFLDDADVVITTYPLLLRDRKVFEEREPSLLILDEAQVLKNSRSQIHKVVAGLGAGQRLALTGTPIENGLDELWSLMSLVVPGLLGDQASFRAHFRQPIEQGADQERMETLRARIAPFVLRRTKDRVAKDLPPKTEIVRPVELQDRQRDLYESIRVAVHTTVQKAVRKKGLSASTIDILGALMKLRQVCCDPRLVAIEAARAVESSAKFAALFDLLEPLLAQERRVLVFSQFTSMLALIGDELRRRRIQHVVLTGATTDRQAAVDAFQSGMAPVFLISLKAGGTGLNLTAADTVIHYDPWWNPAAQAQATDRAYRIGQRRPVFVYNLIVAGSVEERILELQRRKKALADQLLAPEEGQPSLLTANDVAELFAPLE